MVISWLAVEWGGLDGCRVGWIAIGLVDGL